MKIRHFSEHENNTGFSHRNKWNFLTRRITQINMYSMKGALQQPTEVLTTERLIIHVLSRGNDITGLYL